MRPEKANIVSELLGRIKQSAFVIVANYAGLKVDQFSDLRKRLAGAGARCQVAKNTFVHRATREAGMPDMSAYLAGQTAIVTGDKDVAAAAKILKAFATESKKFALRGGVLDNDLLTDKQIEAIAELPAKEVLQAQLLGLLQTPAARLLGTLNEPGASLARLLQARLEKEQAPAA